MPAVNTPQFPGCGPNCPTTRSRYHRSISQKSQRAATFSPPITRTGSNTGSAAARRPPSRPTGSSRPCSTAILPAPDVPARASAHRCGRHRSSRRCGRRKAGQAQAKDAMPRAFSLMRAAYGQSCSASRRGNQPVHRPVGRYACSRGGAGARFAALGPGGRVGPGAERPGASGRRTGRPCPCRLDARAWCRRPASAPRPVSGRAGRRHLCRAGRGRCGGAAARGGLCRLARGSSRGICSSGMRGITHVYRNRDGRCHCDHRCYHLGPAEIAHPQ